MPVSDSVSLGYPACAGAEGKRPFYEFICRLMNKLRPGSIARIDPREDGKLRTSNVTKFLASCSANGLPLEDLFLRDDLIEGTSNCLARVAKTIITLVKWAETPVPTHSHLYSRKRNSRFTLPHWFVFSSSHVLTKLVCSPFRATIITPTSFAYPKYLQAPVTTTSWPSHAAVSKSRYGFVQR